MRKLPIMFLATAFAATSVFAGFGDEPLTEDEWWQKEGFFLGEAFYTQIEPKCGPGDFGSPLVGGGLGIGGEYVNQDLHFGYGGRISMSWLMKDYAGYSADDSMFGFDAHIPVRVSNALTIYAGAGLNVHGMTVLFDQSGEIKTSGNRMTENVFFGLRCRFYKILHLFCEYRRDFGELELGYTGSQLKKQHLDVDMSGNRVMAGLGVTF